jgi:hypothetical protein
MVQGFAQGITAAQAFVRIGVEDKVSAALAVIKGKINQFASEIGRVGASLQQIGLGGGLFGGGILYGIKKATEESSRATEVNTAYAATFRELTDEAQAFADTLASRFKRDVIDVKDIQRSFFGLFAGQDFQRGFSAQAANIFTRLAYDFSSFFNQTVDESASRLLSALSNSAEVVQRFGFNIRSDSLESAFKDLGINKSVEQATEAEKLIARVLILLETSSEAQLNIFGDIDRTINDFANQTRGLQSSITIFLRAIGKPFEKALAPIIGGLAKATANAAEWVQQNPDLVTQVGLLTAGLVAGGGALITFGFGLRFAAFSLGPLVSAVTAPVLWFTKLYDVIGFTLFSFRNLIRFGIAGLIAGIRVLLPLLGGMSTAFMFMGRNLRIVIPPLQYFAALVRGGLGGAAAILQAMARAFVAGFFSVTQSTVLAVTGVNTFASGVRAAAGSTVFATSAVKGLLPYFTGLYTSGQQTAANIGNAANSVRSLIRSATQLGAVRGPSEFFRSIIVGGKNVVSSVQQQYQAFTKISGLLAAPRNIGPANTVQAFSTPIKGLLEGPVKLARTTISEIYDATGNVRQLLLSAPTNIGQANTVTAFSTPIKGFLEGPVKDAKTINDYLGSIRKKTGDAVKGFVNAPQAGMNMIRSYFNLIKKAGSATKNLPAPVSPGTLIRRNVLSGVVESASNLSRSFAQPIDVAFTVIRSRFQILMTQMRIGFNSVAATASSSASSIGRAFSAVIAAIAQSFVALGATMVAAGTAIRAKIAGAFAAVTATVRAAYIATLLFSKGVVATALFPITHTKLFIQMMKFGVIQAVQSARASLLVLRTALAQTAAGLLNMAKSSAIAFRTMAIQGAKVAAVAILPIIAKMAVLSAIAVTIGGLFLLFREQITSAFSAVGAFVQKAFVGMKESATSFLGAAKSVFLDVFDFAKQQFFSLFAIGKSTFTALNNAVTAGDFGLAFKIAIAGAKEAFFSFAFDAVTRWDDTLTAFLSGLIRLKFWFKTIFTEISGFVQTSFEIMESARQSTVNSISRGIISGLVKIGAVDAGVMETLEEDISRQATGRAEARQAETMKQVAAIEAERNEALAGVNAGVGDFRQKLGSALRGAQRESAGLFSQADLAANGGLNGAMAPIELPDASEFMAQIKDQSSAGRSFGESVKESLKGFDIRSSDGFQFMVDAINNRNPNEGVENRLSSIEQTLQNVVPQRVAQSFADELDKTTGTVGLPNTARK